MKQVILLSAAVLSLGSAIAQTNSSGSVVFNKKPIDAKVNPIKLRYEKSRTNSANKGTATSSSWFNYTDIMVDQANGFGFQVFEDSSLVISYTSGPANINWHGFGTSFDPTDSAYIGGDLGYMSAGPVVNAENLPSFRVLRTQAYSVDSIRMPFKYVRNDASVADTLYIQLVTVAKDAANPDGLYSLRFNGGLTGVTPGGRPGFNTVMIDTGTVMFSDSLAAAAKSKVVTLKYTLDQAFFNDTLTNGLSARTSLGIQLPSVLNVPAGSGVVAYGVFKSGKKYPMNTPIENANHGMFVSFSQSGTGATPRQNVNSSQAGLLFPSANRYYDTDTTGGSAFLFEGHNILVPSVIFLGDYFSVDLGFHLTCPTCWDLNAANVSNFNSVKVYPNPASDVVAVSFHLKSAADVKISLTNAMGQVVKSENVGSVSNGMVKFNTSGLASGVYMYTVEAGGQRETGRVAIAH